MPRLAFVTPALAAVLALGAVCAQAQTPRHAPAHQAYERQNCDAGNMQESRATCLKEAAAAQQAARRGDLTAPQGDNAIQRCNVFKTEIDRAACVARVRDGVVSGSVGGGGVLRESTITVPVETK